MCIVHEYRGLTMSLSQKLTVIDDSSNSMLPEIPYPNMGLALDCIKMQCNCTSTTTVHKEVFMMFQGQFNAYHYIAKTFPYLKSIYHFKKY